MAEAAKKIVFHRKFGRDEIGDSGRIVVETSSIT